MRAIEKFLKHFDGNQSKAGRAIGKKPQYLWYWLNKADDMPARYVPDAAKAIGLTSAELMPDVFGGDSV